MRKKLWRYMRYIVPIALLTVFVVLELISRSAAAIFNYAMERQDMLLGTITVEKLLADVFGNVSFENLEWTDERGKRILLVPEGSFTVRLFDVVTQNLKSTTIQSLTLSGANISVRFDDDMRVDFVRQSKVFDASARKMKEPGWEETTGFSKKTADELAAIGERRRRRRQEDVEGRIRNFNRDGRKLRMKLSLTDCRMETFYRDRHYILSDVDFTADINTGGVTKVEASTGVFGGTAIGKGLSIKGSVDFSASSVPECDVDVNFYEVDPSSLGFGLNVHDRMTLTARFTGPVSHPAGEGAVAMEKLHIPALDFTDVKGKIHYEDAWLKFTDVTAKVYGGRLKATGDYNLDTRHYNIHGKGEKLKTRIALPGSHLSCSVKLDIDIASRGSPKDTLTTGSFESGKGTYRKIPFQKISGEFSDAYRDLHFRDVMIDLDGYTISTDAFSITRGKLTLGPIVMTDDEGDTVASYEPRKKERRRAD